VTLLGLINTLTAVVAYSWYITQQVAVAEGERGLMSNLRQLGLETDRMRTILFATNLTEQGRWRSK
jgi:hypothetical protein